MVAVARFARHFGPVVDVLYPPRCPSCGVAIASQEGLCSDCWSSLDVPSHDGNDTGGVPVHAATAYLQRLIKAQGEMSFRALIDALEVSPATLKRDLAYLRDPDGHPCLWHAAVFQHLFRALVWPEAQVTEVECQAQGAALCRFELRPHP